MTAPPHTHRVIAYKSRLTQQGAEMGRYVWDEVPQDLPCADPESCPQSEAIRLLTRAIFDQNALDKFLDRPPAASNENLKARILAEAEFLQKMGVE